MVRSPVRGYRRVFGLGATGFARLVIAFDVVDVEHRRAESSFGLKVYQVLGIESVTHVTGKDTRKVVGATGFEPATPCAQGRCATRLRYAPTSDWSSDSRPFSNCPSVSSLLFQP